MEKELEMVKAIIEIAKDNKDDVIDIINSVKPIISEILIDNIIPFFYEQGGGLATTKARYYRNLFMAFTAVGFSREEAVLLLLNTKTNTRTYLDNLSKNKK